MDSTLKALDLTGISRDPDKVKTVITIGQEWDAGRLVITLGEISLTERDSSHNRGKWNLTAYWRDGATDFEHDSAYILRLPLVGVQLDMLAYGQLIVKGFVGGDPDDCRVPPSNYEGKCMEVAQTCDTCKGKDKHLLLPEGLYWPPKDPDMFARIAGLQVDIRIRQAENKKKTK